MTHRWPWIAAALLAAASIAAVAILMARAALSGDSFRTLVEAHGGRALGGWLELSPLEWQGPEVTSNRLRLGSRDSSPLASLEATDLRARWNWQAVFSGAWKLEECHVDSLSASFQTNRAPIPSTTPPDIHTPAWLAALLPDRFELSKLRIRHADFDFDGLALKGTSLVLRQDAASWKITATGGILSTPYCQPLDIDFIHGRWQTSGFSLLDSSLRAGTDGRLRAVGDWPGTMRLEGKNLALRDFLDAHWRESVVGTLSGDATIQTGGAVGRVEITGGRLRGLPWLRELATLTGRNEFGDLSFSKATGDFETREGIWHWRSLVLESATLLRIEGDATIFPGGGLSGRLRVGVAERVLESLPGSRQFVFTEPEGGYLWTPVVLGGTLDAPTEDLSRRLAAAVGGAVIESVQPLLDSVPAPSRDAVGNTLDKLLDFLRP